MGAVGTNLSKRRKPTAGQVSSTSTNELERVQEAMMESSIFSGLGEARWGRLSGFFWE